MNKVFSFENDLCGFEARGEVELTRVSGREGRQCLKIGNRVNQDGGAGICANEWLQTGNAYKITTWLRQDSGSAQTIYAKLDFVNIDGKQEYINIGRGYTQSGEWTKAETRIESLNNYTGDLILYWEAYDTPGWDIFIDTIEIEQMKVLTVEEQIEQLTDIYEDMIQASFISAGNNERMLRAMEKAARGEDVTIAYLGGSITEGASATTDAQTYAYQTYEYIKKKATDGKGDNVHFVNAGMGGTPSTLGMIRYERDILRQGYTVSKPISPDIFFLEFAVNDGDDPTLGDSYESIIRTVLNTENQPAVFLLFCVFQSQWNLQGRLIPIGVHYGLPMVSIRNAVIPRINDGQLTNEQFFASDGLHPTNLGHHIMADSIVHCLEEMQKQEKAEPFEIPEHPVVGKKYENLHIIDTVTQPDGVTIQAGSFTERDHTTGTYKFAPDREKMGDNWQHLENAGTNSYVMKLTCKNLAMAYKRSSDPISGEVEVFIDGEKCHPLVSLHFETGERVETLDCYKKDGWNNAWVAILLDEETEAKSHTVEVKMAKGSEKKQFTILAWGYNQ